MKYLGRLSFLALSGWIISAQAAPLTIDMINGAGLDRVDTQPDEKKSADASKGDISPSIIKIEVLLDRLGFSPGVIDGRDGENFQKALKAYRDANSFADNAAALAKLEATSPEPVMVDYTTTNEDEKGPFLKSVPTGFDQLSKLPALSYTSAKEALAERFHMDEKLLSELNPNVAFDKAGSRITVANIRADKKGKVTKIDIDKQARTVRAFDAQDRLVAFYPASIGSEEKPAPSGSFKVRTVQRNPIYHYNPDFAFKGVKSKKPLTIKAGPNNPVGAVWIDLTVPSYGIHGTPNPEKISKTESHGCVRLTNWDALQLGAMVVKGANVNFLN